MTIEESTLDPVYIPTVLLPILVNLATKKRLSIILWIRIALFLKSKPDSKTSRILEHFLSYYENYVPENARKILKQAIIPEIESCKTIGKSH